MKTIIPNDETVNAKIRKMTWMTTHHLINIILEVLARTMRQGKRKRHKMKDDNKRLDMKEQIVSIPR